MSCPAVWTLELVIFKLTESKQRERVYSGSPGVTIVALPCLHVAYSLCGGAGWQPRHKDAQAALWGAPCTEEPRPPAQNHRSR